LGKSYKKNEVRESNKGLRYEVEPFKSKKDIEKIKQYLRGKTDKRDYALFVLGINVGLRTQDLVALQIKDVSNSKTEIKNKVQIVEQKTKKIREIEINHSAAEALKLYLGEKKEYDPEGWLFPSRKGDNHLSVDGVRKIIKTVSEEVGIQGNYGAHSLRKTFGHHVYLEGYKNNPLILPTLQKIFNHSSQNVTLAYIGIQSSQISSLYKDLNIWFLV